MISLLVLILITILGFFLSRYLQTLTEDVAITHVFRDAGFPEGREKNIISNYDDFQDWFKNARLEENHQKIIIELFSEEFFKEQSLAILEFSTATGSTQIRNVKALINNDLLEVSYRISRISRNPFRTMSARGVIPYLLIIQIPKNITEINVLNWYHLES